MRITFVFDNNHFGIGVLHHACMSTTTTVSVNQTKWKTKGYRSSTTLPLAVDLADTALWFCNRKPGNQQPPSGGKIQPAQRVRDVIA